MAILILFNLFLGFAHDALPRDWKVMPVHKSIGLTVLALAVARILWRFTRRAPALPAGMPAWERGAAHATHFAFYAFMLVLPLTGWIMTRSEEHTSELQSLMRISYAVFCLKKKKPKHVITTRTDDNQ